MKNEAKMKRGLSWLAWLKRPKWLWYVKHTLIACNVMESDSFSPMPCRLSIIQKKTVFPNSLQQLIVILNTKGNSIQVNFSLFHCSTGHIASHCHSLLCPSLGSKTSALVCWIHERYRYDESLHKFWCISSSPRAPYYVIGNAWRDCHGNSLHTCCLTAILHVILD